MNILGSKFTNYNRRITTVLILIGFLLNISSTKAQLAFDTIRNSINQKPHFFGKLDSRNSFIENNRALIIGFKIGLNYNDKIRFGIGYNMLFPTEKQLQRMIYFTNSNNDLDSVKTSIKLSYLSLHTEYVYHKNESWEFSIPFQIGIGQTYYQYQNNEKREITGSIPVFIYEPSVSVEYKITKWLGVGTGIGFRFMMSESKELNHKFNSPTYAFKLLVYYNELVSSIWKKKEVAEKEKQN